MEFGPDSQALAAQDPRQLTWLPDGRTVLTVIADYGKRGNVGYVSVLTLGEGELSNRMVPVEYGDEVAAVRLVPLPDGRVVLVTGDDASLLRPRLEAVRTQRRNLGGMCRNIRPLNNFEPPATDDEVNAAALQFVRKVSGTTKPSAANQAIFDQAVHEIAHVVRHLIDDLVTTAPPKDREVEAAKARERAALRYAQ